MCLRGGSLRTPIPCHTGLPKFMSTRGSLSLHHQPFHSHHNPGSGSTYSIWKLTDLDQTMLSIFLFSGAHEELWKQAPGTLIAIFTPKVKNDRELCLTAISGDQVWVLGTAAEFGYCRAQKKVWRREGVHVHPECSTQMSSWPLRCKNEHLSGPLPILGRECCHSAPSSSFHPLPGWSAMPGPREYGALPFLSLPCSGRHSSGALCTDGSTRRELGIPHCILGSQVCSVLQSTPNRPPPPGAISPRPVGV